MPHGFEHLPLLLRYQGRARLSGGGKQSPQTIANRNARQAHSGQLRHSGLQISANWETRQQAREVEELPTLPRSVPILLQVDPGLDLDVLREKFSFEIVAEQENGFVIVASEDIQLAPFLAMLEAFSVQIHGSATIAKIHRLFDDPAQADRLASILSANLLAEWPTITDAQIYIVDIGIACSGTQEIPALPKRGKRATDAVWAVKESEWSVARASAYEKWDEVKQQRENETLEFIKFYAAEILHMIDGEAFDAAVLPDSFSIRIKISGMGLKDFVLNYPYIFEVVEPEDIELPQQAAPAEGAFAVTADLAGPDENAPYICVIDSGIQEGHAFIASAIDQGSSRCFLPGRPTTEVGDFVSPSGHGTRVAGAALFGETLPQGGIYKHSFWVQNARVLNQQNKMPVELFPPDAIRKVVERYHLGDHATRIFNHSINAQGVCRTRYMSAWAAEIDQLCAEYDVLLVQSAGNLPINGPPPNIGIRDHLVAGRAYPDYFREPSTRIANPGQSLQALTVGSIAYGAFQNPSWTTFAQVSQAPSAFSRAGPGIWNVIKPEVVEYGGDAIRNENLPPSVRIGGTIQQACPELIRSTLFSPGPAFDRDACGTSFAAPKVARIAAKIQEVLPNEPSLLYRALVVQSAHWPQSAEEILTQLRNQDPQMTYEQRENLHELATHAIRSIGYGIPDESRATTNSDFRTTFITSGHREICAAECHIYQVPIPPELRLQGDEFDIRIDVTMSYVAQPRRTRRNLRRYLSTWVDWKASNLGEGVGSFRLRAMRNVEEDGEAAAGSTLPWTLQEKPQWGFVRDVKRNSGTVQKDWAIVKSNTLPDHFCIAVVGHQGWSRDPDSVARYVLAVSFEILGQEIAIYDPLRTAVLELQTDVAELEEEVQILVEEDE
jgi:hypothetical protein